MSSSFYRGIYTSLYIELPKDAIQHIERAIWLRMTGNFDTARAIFDNELKPFGNVAIIAIEYTDLELDACRWGQGWRILDTALKYLNDTGANLDLPEHRLMAITRAMIGVRHRGDVDSSALEIERTKQWLHDVPVAEYTDIQV
jgi:hypothetical protein